MPADSDIANEFGSGWTLIKLEAIAQYFGAYTTALQNQPFKRLYIDAFAGSGSCDVVIDGNVRRVDGSAKRALDAEPRFDELVFIEKHGGRCAALQSLAEQFPHRSLQVVRGDANEVLVELCRRTPWRNTRAVLFLDPFGMNVPWSTLEAVAATRAIDVWYLFALSSLYRQMARRADGIDPGKAAAVTRVLGTDTWRTDLYQEPAIKDLFGHDHDERHADVGDITRFVTVRLRTIFPSVLEPRILHQAVGRIGKQGAPLFALYFAVSNPRGVTVAGRIAKHILDSL